MKPLLTIIAAFFLFSIPLAAYQAPTTRNENKQADASAPPTVIAEQAPSTQPPKRDGQGETDATRDPHGWVDYVNAFSTLVIAIFTIALFAAVVVQIRTSRNTERAWMMVDVGWNPTSSVRMAELTTGSGGEKTGAFFRMTYRNQGRSPAWITEKRVAMKVVDSVPLKPDFSSTKLIQKTPEPLPVDGPSSIDIQCDCDGRAGFPKLTLVYGAVEYRDIFGKTRETRFGYVIGQNNRMQRLEEPKYNVHT